MYILIFSNNTYLYKYSPCQKEKIYGPCPSAPPMGPWAKLFWATSKVDFGHTFLTYSHFSGACGDNLRRLCGGISIDSWAINGGE